MLFNAMEINNNTRILKAVLQEVMYTFNVHGTVHR